MANELTVVQQVRQSMDRMAPEFRAVLPSHVSAEAFARVAQTALQVSPQLQNCTPKSILAACTRCAEAGLLPDGRQAALVAYGSTAQLIPMVEGMRELVRRSGAVKDWRVNLVREGDFFDYTCGDHEALVHKPKLGNDAPVIAVYSIAILESGEISRNVMSIHEVEMIRRKSRSGNSGPWVEWRDEMIKKSCMRRHFKYLPKSTDRIDRAQAAITAYDDAVGPVDITPRHEPLPEPTHAIDAARQRLESAIQDSPFEEIQQPAQQTAAADVAKKTRAPRKTAAEKLAEVEEGNRQRAEAAAAKASEKAAPKPEEERKPINWREGDEMPSDLQDMNDGRDLAYEAACGADGRHDDAVLDALDDSSEEDPDAAAYRDGFKTRLKGKPRVPNRELCQDQGTASAWLQGWDESDARAKAGTSPKNWDEAEAALDEIVGRVFA